MGAALLAKLPKRVWGKSRNVTDNSPTRLEALREIGVLVEVYQTEI